MLMFILNEKKIVGALSLIMVALMPRAVPAKYYVLFSAIIFATLFIESYKARKPLIYSTHYPIRLALCAGIALAIMAIFLIMYESHLSYTNSLNVSVYYNATGHSNNLSKYGLTITYNHFQGQVVHILLLERNSSSINFMGLNYSLISSQTACQANLAECTLNNNIVLNGSGEMSQKINLPANYNHSGMFFRAVLYGGKYFYVSPTMPFAAPQTN